MGDNIKISIITTSIRPKGLDIVRECLEKQTFKSFEWLVDIGLDRVDINQAHNRCLSRAKGELVVFYQDYIKIAPDALQGFWEAHKRSPKFYTAPVGKTDDENYSGKVEWDWRKYRQGKVDWLEWEIDWGSAPLEALKRIGGFDEELDKYWGFDNVNVGLRAEMAGYEFECVDIPAIAWNHDKFMKHPHRNKRNPNFHNQRLEQIRQGIIVDYINMV